jgi:hypothetical protein
MGAVLLFPSSGITYKYRATKRGFASALLAEPARLVAASWRVEPTSVHTWPNKSGVLKSTRDAGVVKGAPRRRWRAAAAQYVPERVRICWTA